MIANNDQNKQLPNEIKSTFKELNVLKHLRDAGITKSFGFSCANIFQLFFCLMFENKNWLRMLESRKSTDVPAEDTVYRFLKSFGYTKRWKKWNFTLHSYDASQWCSSQGGLRTQ